MKTDTVGKRQSFIPDQSKIRLAKGFKDYTGEEAVNRVEIKKVLVETFERYGFEPAETPVIEYEDFVRGQNTGDGAVSDIFKLQDKGKRKLALRYEWTFQLKRLMQNKKLPYKRYSIGEVFRDEPISANRFRQFTQCDIDIVGSTVRDEAEILKIVAEVFEKLGINIRLYFNNRKLLNEILEKEGVKAKDRDQVIREIDKIDKLPEAEIKKNLKKFKAEGVLRILKKPKKSFEKYKAYSEIEALKSYLKISGVAAEFVPSLARGLSYYNGGVFEIKTAGVKETIAGGGSYMFNGKQSTGISFGLDRIASLVDIKPDKEKYLVVSLKEDKIAIALAQKLRANDNAVSMFYRKPSKALEYANSYKIKKVVFVGKEEIKKGKKFKVKDMDSGKESVLRI